MEVKFPNPRHTVADMQEPAVRDREIDPKKKSTTRPTVRKYREPQRNFPNEETIDISQVVQKQLRAT